MQVPSGTLRRQQPELPPLGDPLALRCSTFCPKAAPSSAAPFLALTTLPLNRRPLLGYIWVRGPQSLAANSTAFMEWKVARSSVWTFLVTQGPTCPIAALLYALVSDAEGPYLNRLSQRKPLSVSDICPAKLVTWHPVIPNGSYLLHGPRQTLPGCVLIAILGDPNRVRAGSAERTRLGDGGGSSY